MQPAKRHLPIVGLIGLVALAAAGGGIYYYQYIIPHAATCSPPVHRLIFMTAIIHEQGGFFVTNAAILNGTMPKFDNINGANLTGVSPQYYRLADPTNHTIGGNPGDIMTLYIKSVNSTSPDQQPAIPGHGFAFTTSPEVNGTVPSLLPFGQWRTVTFTVTNAGTYSYACTIFCSKEHSQMTGSIVVGCG